MKYFYKCIHTVNEWTVRHYGPISYHTLQYPWLCHGQRGCVVDPSMVVYACICTYPNNAMCCLCLANFIQYHITHVCCRICNIAHVKY